MSSIVRRLEEEFNMEIEYVSSSSSSSAIIYPEDAAFLGYTAEEIRARLALQFFEDEANQQYEEGEIYEDPDENILPPPLDVVIVSHLLSKSETGHFDCPICYEESIPTAKRVTISCGHHFCMTCTVNLLKNCQQEEKNVTCPMCRHPCFLLETPDEPQFKEIGQLLDEFAELRDIREQQDFEAFRYYHYG